MPTVADVVAYLDRFAPPVLAAEWDNVGLLAGDPALPANRILTCLTITSDVVEEAIAERVELIVSHHPVMFRGVKKLTPQSPDGRVLPPLLRHGIAVYSPHTAFDNCPGGINDGLARRLGLIDVQPLRKAMSKPECKLVVFVPDVDLAKVSDAMFAAGAGKIGQYEQCSFRVPGTGSFFGNDSTNPTVGVKGRRENVSEWRLEVVVPEKCVDAVIAAMRQSHSYEEPAFDVYPLRGKSTGGEGRIGQLAAPVPLSDLAKLTKAQLHANGVQLVGDPGKLVQSVAIACGAAGEFLPDAIAAQADVFLTGEIRFHDCQTAQAANIAVILPGHYATERPGIEYLAGQLAAAFPATTVNASQRERDPLSWQL